MILFILQCIKTEWKTFFIYRFVILFRTTENTEVKNKLILDETQLTSAEFGNGSKFLLV